ncbi:F0F1 ATP synthase subunit B family protein [Helicobacter cynogastricus]|uniref:F0F1 ATP synthase subunit B family protein n=1 Tax=Helicobacter cynogastricus TaxID=329937 RepID=UPI000CF0BCBC|nr:F0F1 ATP synthase subunit B' [Helicobacter cynogastricus]
MDISINVYLMLVVFVSFLILMWLSHMWIYKPILANMDARKKAMDQDGSFVDQTSREIVVLQEEAKTQLKQARAQAHKILQEALHKAKSDYESVVTQKEEALNKELEVFIQGLKNSRGELALELSQNLPLLEASLKQKITQI